MGTASGIGADRGIVGGRRKGRQVGRRNGRESDILDLQRRRRNIIQT